MQINASSTYSVMRVESEAAKTADTFYRSIVNDDVTTNVHSLLNMLNSLWINRKNPNRIKKFAASVIVFGSSLYKESLKCPSEVVEAINSSADFNECTGTGGWSVIMRILSHITNRAMYRQRFIALYMANLLYQGLVCASDRLLLLMTLQNDVMQEFVSSHISLLAACLSEYPSFYNCWTLPPSDCSLPVISKNEIIRCQHDLLCALIISRGGVAGLVGKASSSSSSSALHSSSFNTMLQRKSSSSSSLSYATILSSISGGTGDDQDQDYAQESSQQIVFEDTVHLVKFILDTAVDSVNPPNYSSSILMRSQ